MQKRFRLTRSDDFKRVRQMGKSFAHPLVVLVIQSNQAKNIKVGVTAGKAIGTAVQRNRAKRLLREAMRNLIPNIASGTDLILVARAKLVTSSLADVTSALTNLFERANLFITLDD